MRLMSRSHSIIKHSDGRLQRFANKFVSLLPAEWRRTFKDRLLENNPIAKRFRQLDVAFTIRQMALPIAVVFAALMIAYCVYFLFLRIIARFSFRSEQ